MIVCATDGNMGTTERENTAPKNEKEPKTMTNELFTTMRALRETTSANGAVVRYGFRVFRVDGNENDGYRVEVYEFPDEPQELGYPEDECRLQGVVGKGRRHRDAGSALHWAIRLA